MKIIYVWPPTTLCRQALLKDLLLLLLIFGGQPQPEILHEPAEAMQVAAVPRPDLVQGRPALHRGMAEVL